MHIDRIKKNIHIASEKKQKSGMEKEKNKLREKRTVKMGELPQKIERVKMPPQDKELRRILASERTGVREDRLSKWYGGGWVGEGELTEQHHTHRWFIRHYGWGESGP